MTEKRNLKVSKGNDNIFEDLGFNTSEAINLKIRADLMLELRQYIQSQNWTQQQAAEFFEETQPRINSLMNGEINRFSVDKLIKMLGKIGLEVKLQIFSKTA
jgi:predicted XRE-type DNA-binding protein